MDHFEWDGVSNASSDEARSRLIEQQIFNYGQIEPTPEFVHELYEKALFGFVKQHRNFLKNDKKVFSEVLELFDVFHATRLEFDNWVVLAKRDLHGGVLCYMHTARKTHVGRLFSLTAVMRMVKAIKPDLPNLQTEFNF